MTQRTITGPSDRRVREAALAAIAWVLPETADVRVEVETGVVRIAGTVHSIEDRDRVVAAALDVEGARVVVDDVEVLSLRRGPVDDRSVAREVRRVLEGMPSLQAVGLRARVRHGVVTVSGVIAWRFERATVLNLVAAVPGVADVVDAVVVARPRPVLRTEDLLVARELVD
jgi:osmotically-inducible protein OsmY